MKSVAFILVDAAFIAFGLWLFSRPRDKFTGAFVVGCWTLCLCIDILRCLQ